MTVKEFLISIRKQERYLQTLERELDRLNYEVYHLKGIQMGDKVQGNHIPDLAEIVERLEAYKTKVNDEWDSLLENRVRARALISNLTDEIQRCILNRRYIQVQSWETIAEEMHISEPQLFKLHGTALAILAKFYKDDSK